MNSWRWNELEEDVLDELPHVCQIIYLRIMRKHMDYSTGIVGRTRKISYEQIKERLRYTPPTQSREKPVEYSTDQIKKLIRKLVKAGLLERLHDTSQGVQPMEFRLPLACTDADSSASSEKPRTMTTGMASAPCPISGDAAAAISSASATSVTCIGRSNKSIVCRKSIRGLNPATPSAWPTVPLRQARPILSLTITPTRRPLNSLSAAANRAAEASGSSGNSMTWPACALD